MYKETLDVLNNIHTTIDKRLSDINSSIKNLTNNISISHNAHVEIVNATARISRDAATITSAVAQMSNTILSFKK